MRLPRDAVRRRRLAALAAAAMGALAVGVAIGSGGERDAPPRERAPAPHPEPVERQAGRTILIAYDGPSPPAYVLRALRSGRAAGVILFADNARSPEALRRATRTLQEAAGGSALVAVDQEGPAARALSWAPPHAGQPAQAGPAAAAGEARAAARALREAGVNVTLGPVADVARPGAAFGGRTFPGGGRRVAESVSAAVRAYREGGVAATPKHFPGLGGATANTDDVAVTIEGPLAGDLVPFRAAARARAPLVMVGHALYPALARTRIASQSPRILRDLLRGRLGFRGAVVTDSMEAEAVLTRSGVGEAGVRAIAAGADLLLLTGPGSYPEVRARLEAEARRSPRFRARLAEAGERVLTLRRSLGLSGGGGTSPPPSGSRGDR